jgi:hypothetical protein
MYTNFYRHLPKFIANNHKNHLPFTDIYRSVIKTSFLTEFANIQYKLNNYNLYLQRPLYSTKY